MFHRNNCWLRPLAALSLVVLAGAAIFVGPDEAAAKEKSAGNLLVATDKGQLRGRAEGPITSFKGIPYAEPPTGPKRWRAPQPAKPWKGVRAAARYGNACIQPPGLSAENGGDPGPLSEDCLYLNVWTPGADPEANRPVIFWIHGGAYTFGSGNIAGYSGVPFAKKGAVFVSINYRLGQLGFFAHPALEKNNPGGPVNFGLLDQIAALKWVRSNIKKFGGNPGNVTIMGQSAGAKSVFAMMASPLARGLFKKAVALSSYVIPDAKRAKAVEAGTKVATALGLNGANAGLRELRQISAERFGALKGEGLSNAPVPVSGDPVLPRAINKIFADGKEARVPLIVGNTSDDASVVAAFGFDPAKVLDRLGAAKALVKLLYRDAKNDADVARQAMRDLIFTMPVRWTADRHNSYAPVWRFYFDYVSERERRKFPNGVPHGFDVVYFLNTGAIDPEWKDILTKRDHRYAQLVNEYIFQFAKTGRPSSKGGPRWPDDKGPPLKESVMVFDDKPHISKRFMPQRLKLFIGVTKILDALFSRG